MCPSGHSCRECGRCASCSCSLTAGLCNKCRKVAKVKQEDYIQQESTNNFTISQEEKVNRLNQIIDNAIAEAKAKGKKDNRSL